MKKLIYILILIGVCTLNLELKAKDNKIKLDSIVSPNKSKEVFEYDQNGNIILEIKFEWDTNKNEWLEVEKYEYEYDNYGNQTIFSWNNWDLDLNEWLNYFKKNVIYDYEFDNQNIINPLNYGKYKYLYTIYHDWDYNNNIPIIDTAQYYYSEFNPTSIENEVVINPNFLIFPNPTSDKISVDLGESNEGVADLTIYDNLGNEIMNIPNYTNKSEIDVSTIPIGTYTIQIQTETGSTSQRLLVNR